IGEHESEVKRIEAENRSLEKDEQALRKRATSFDRATEYLLDNKVSSERDVEGLAQERDELVKKISELPKLDNALGKAKAAKKTLGEKEGILNDKLKEISIAKSYLKEHSTSTQKALDHLSRRRDELKMKLDSIPEIRQLKSGGKNVLWVLIENPERRGTFIQTRDVENLTGVAIDDHSGELLSQTRALAAEASKFDENEYTEKANQLDKLRRETVPNQSAKVQLYKGQIEKDEEEVRRLTEALGEVQRAGDFVAILTKIRDRVYYRDGPVPSSLRSWALKHIGAKASEYARLFEIGVSNIDLKEKARDISIECSGPRGTVDTASLSGGEKVAIA
ncbi:MAG: hypothetical protein OK454_12540, partial [Thaumarchaeota archaeon]|nr:hypothetical protein [Nitrososphaerota archaeon]